jgi:hypothetical protein
MEYRTKLFYFGCVPARLGLAILFLIGFNPMISGVSVLGCITLLMAAGFMVNHYREKKTGFFGGEAWWHDFRKFHSVMWSITSVMLFLDFKYAGVVVIYDLIPGFIDVCRGVNLQTSV